MRYNLSEREVQLLLQSVSEYIELMGEAEDTHDYTEYMINNGLGSAIKELGKGRKVGSAYKKYTKHREGYNYPTFEEWLSRKKEDD